jgi:hypothetical protein
MRNPLRGNPFTEQLPGDSPAIVDMFTGRYQATHVPSRDHCIITTYTLQYYEKDRIILCAISITPVEN